MSSDSSSERNWRTVAFLTALILPFWFLVWGPTPAQADEAALFSTEQRAILDAIRFVESGDRPNPPDGDGGLAIGPYQIHEIYWRDAVEANPELGGGYQDCREKDYAERVVAAYMGRYAKRAWAQGGAETIARIHNGGPEGARKDATLPYWRKVRNVLDARPDS